MPKYQAAVDLFVATTFRRGDYMSAKYIANGKAREYVRKLEVFKGSNIWSEWYEKGIDGVITKRYVVYSYRYTFPLFVYDPMSDTWYENSTKYSRTTSKHKTQLHPCVPTIPLCLGDMGVVVRHGSVGLISYSTKVNEEMQDVPF
jgi:hypothetical protein